MNYHRSFLKWAGGKHRLLPRLLPIIGNPNRVIEPFVGAGNVFINLDVNEYVLADNNKDLINCYKTLQTKGDELLTELETLFLPDTNDKTVYLKLRDEFNKSEYNLRRAALFIYLNRHGFNGLCRYNASGKFNVTFGKYDKIYFPEKELCHFISKLSNDNIQLTVADFEDTFKLAKEGDVVYCDPPYLPLTSTANFVSYSKSGFDVLRHERLSILAEIAVNRGATVIISNHHTKYSHHLYKRASKIDTFLVGRFISSKGMTRTPVEEILAVYKG